jgi:hypothetical protein
MKMRSISHPIYSLHHKPLTRDFKHKKPVKHRNLPSQV